MFVTNSMKTLILVLSFCSCIAQAQVDTEGSSIMKPITTLFTGLNLGDSSMVRSAFTADATMASISKDKAGNVTLRRESSLTGFLKAIGSPHKDSWSEPIWDARIEVDGNFAQVWTQYAFYAGKNFIHCGVDAFQLIKTNATWKIFHLVDTRRKDGCSVPKPISDQFK